MHIEVSNCFLLDEMEYRSNSIFEDKSYFFYIMSVSLKVKLQEKHVPLTKKNNTNKLCLNQTLNKSQVS